MKKYIGKTGGRYIYNSDLDNIQNIGFEILNALFEDSGDMVIGGCQINKAENKLTKGSVLIGGVLRDVPETKYTKLPLYIYEKNISESVQYEDEQNKEGRVSYMAIVSETKPTEIIDPYTNKLVQFLEITGDESKDRTLRTVFFNGTNGVFLKNTVIKQIVGSIVEFSNKISFKGDVDFSEGLNIDTDCNIFYDSNKLTISIKGQSLFELYNNGDIALPVHSIQIKNGAVISSKLQAGDIFIENNNVFVKSGELVVNRNTEKKKVGFQIYDGIQSIIKFIANSKFISFLLGVKINKNVSIYDSENLKENEDYETSIVLGDKSETKMVSIVSNSKRTLVKNEVSDFTIESKNINLDGDVKENGQLVSEKYLHQETYNADIKTFVKTESGKGLSDENYTKAEKTKLKNIKTSTIESSGDGYVTAKDVKSTTDNFVNKANKLSDLTQDSEDIEADQREICKNIGASFNQDTQPKATDTGWVKMLNAVSGEIHTLFARQIDNRVYIQGKVNCNLHVNWVLAKIPNNIGTPRHDVYRSWHQISSAEQNRGVSVKIDATTTLLKIYEMHRYDNNTIIINIEYLTN